MEESYNWIKARIIVNGKPILVRQEDIGSDYFISKETGVRFPVRELDFKTPIGISLDEDTERDDMLAKECKVYNAVSKREYWRKFRGDVYLHLIDKSDGMISPNGISKFANEIFTHAISQDNEFFSVFDKNIFC